MKQKFKRMIRMRFSFVTMFVLGAILVLNSCKDEFSDEDFLKQKLAAEQAAMDEARRNDSLKAIGRLIDYTVNVVYGNTSSFGNQRVVGSVAGAVVTVVQGDRVESRTSDESGLVTFSSLRRGGASVNIRLDGFTPVDYIVTFVAQNDNNADGANAPAQWYASNNIPIFEIPVAGGDPEKFATVSGQLTADIDLTDSDIEPVSGVRVSASMDITNGFVANFNRGNDDFGQITSISYGAATFGASSAADGMYEFMVPAFASGQGLPYNVYFDDFAADQTYFADALGGDASLERVTVRATFSASHTDAQVGNANANFPNNNGLRGDLQVAITPALAGGNGAVVAPVLSNNAGMVTSVTVSSGGSYTHAPTVMIGGNAVVSAGFDAATGEVTEVNVVSGGSGYTSAPAVSFRGMREIFVGGAANADQEDAIKTKLGYNENYDKITFVDANNDPVEFVNANGGVVDKLHLELNGQNIDEQVGNASVTVPGPFTQVPAVEVSGGNPTTAAVIGTTLNADGSVSFTIDNGGAEYEDAPSITVSDPIEEAATAKVSRIGRSTASIDEIAIDDDAYGMYTQAPVATLTEMGTEAAVLETTAGEHPEENDYYQVDRVLVVSGGAGYPANTGVEFEDDVETRASLQAVFTENPQFASATIATAIDPADQGSGYTEALTVSAEYLQREDWENGDAWVDASAGVYEMGQFNVMMEGTPLTDGGLVITSSGLGYTRVPSATITDGATTTEALVWGRDGNFADDQSAIGSYVRGVLGGEPNNTPILDFTLSNNGPIHSFMIDKSVRGVTYKADEDLDRIRVIATSVNNANPSEAQFAFEGTAVLSNEAADGRLGDNLVVQVEEGGAYFAQPASVTLQNIEGSIGELNMEFDILGTFTINFDQDAEFNNPPGDQGNDNELDDAGDDFFMSIQPNAGNGNNRAVLEVSRNNDGTFDRLSVVSENRGEGFTAEDIVALREALDQGFERVLTDINIGGIPSGQAAQVNLNGRDFFVGLHKEASDARTGDDFLVSANAQPISFNADANNSNEGTIRIAGRITSVEISATTGNDEITAGANPSIIATGGINNENANFQAIEPEFPVASITIDFAGGDFSNEDEIELTFQPLDNNGDLIGALGAKQVTTNDANNDPGIYQKVAKRVKEVAFVDFDTDNADNDDDFETGTEADSGNGDGFGSPTVELSAPDLEQVVGFEVSTATMTIASSGLKAVAVGITNAGVYSHMVDAIRFTLAPADADAGNDSATETVYHVFDGGAVDGDGNPDTGDISVNAEYAFSSNLSVFDGGLGYVDGTYPRVLSAPTASFIDLNPQIAGEFSREIDYTHNGAAGSYFATEVVENGSVSGIAHTLSTMTIDADKNEDYISGGFTIYATTEIEAAQATVSDITSKSIAFVEVTDGGTGYTAAPMAYWAEVDANNFIPDAWEGKPVMGADVTVENGRVTGVVINDNNIPDDLLRNANIEFKTYGGDFADIDVRAEIADLSNYGVGRVLGFGNDVRTEMAYPRDPAVWLYAYAFDNNDDVESTVGTGATGLPIRSNTTQQVVGVDVASPGTGYNPADIDAYVVVVSTQLAPASATAAVGTTGGVESALVAASGNDYLRDVMIIFEPTGLPEQVDGNDDMDEIVDKLMRFDGTLATATGTVVNGKVTEIANLVSGSGYTDVEAVHVLNHEQQLQYDWVASGKELIRDGNNNITYPVVRTAAVTGVEENGGLKAVVVTDPGYGYVNIPVVTVTGSGTGATAEVQASGFDAVEGKVLAVAVTNAGTGYTQSNFPSAARGSSVVDMLGNDGDWDIRVLGGSVRVLDVHYGVGVRTRVN